MHIANCNADLNVQDTIKNIDLDEIKGLMMKAPPSMKSVMNAVAVMLGLKPALIKDPANPAKTIQDWWSPGSHNNTISLSNIHVNDFPIRYGDSLRL